MKWPTYVVTAVAAASVACTIYADPVTADDIAEDAAICSDAAPVIGGDCFDKVDDTTGKVTSSLCEYGGNEDLGCNTGVTCVANTGFAGFAFVWTITDLPLALSCATNDCPATRAEIQDGASCDPPTSGTMSPVLQYVCGYPEGTCGCIASASGATWKCVNPPPAPCPPERPLIGHYCDHDALLCDYGACAFEHSAAMVCSRKTWQLADTSCK